MIEQCIPKDSWNTQSFQKVAVLLAQRLTYATPSLPPISTTEGVYLPIPIPLLQDPTPTPYEPPDPPSSVDLLGKGCITVAAFRSLRTHFPMSHSHSGRSNTHTLQQVSNTFQTLLSGEEKKRGIQECIFGTTSAGLDPVTTTLSDVRTHLRTLIKLSTTLLGHSLESDLHALKLSHPTLQGGTNLPPHVHLRLRPGANMAYEQVALPYYTGLGGLRRHDYRLRNDAEDLDGLLGNLDSHEYVFGRPMASDVRDRLTLTLISGPIATARWWHQQHPVLSRDGPEQQPDNTTCNAPTAHGAALILGTQWPALDVRVYRTPGGVPREATGEPG
ncbi:hypothetical protein V8E53_000235 [Lactarius tabidus]